MDRASNRRIVSQGSLEKSTKRRYQITYMKRLTMLADVQWAKIWKWHAVTRIFMHGGGKVSIPFLREILFRGKCISNTGDFLLK